MVTISVFINEHVLKQIHKDKKNPKYDNEMSGSTQAAESTQNFRNGLLENAGQKSQETTKA